MGPNGTLTSTKTGLAHEDKLVPAEENMQGVDRSLNDLMVQQKFFEYRKARQNEEVAAVGRKSLYIAITETLVVIGLTVWQVYYIKKMLDFRQSV